MRTKYRKNRHKKTSEKTDRISSVLKEYRNKDILSILNQLATGKAKHLIFRIESKHYLVNANKSSACSYYKYRTFCKNIKCVSCGIAGTSLRLERQKTHALADKIYSLNLYARNSKGDVLMTKDHIRPVSKGGTNRFDNLQTMCETCNNKKGNN